MGNRISPACLYPFFLQRETSSDQQPSRWTGNQMGMMGRRNGHASDATLARYGRGNGRVANARSVINIHGLGALLQLCA